MERPEVEAAAQFARGLGVLDVRRHGSGNVHRSYLVRPKQGPRFLLQRLNTRVFPRPGDLMGNLRAVAEHVRRRLASGAFPKDRRWEVPEPLPTPDGRDLWGSPDGGVWRALRFVESAHSRPAARDAGEAREVGWALGAFHALTSDLPVAGLADTLPGFHVTPLYLERYDRALAAAACADLPDLGRCLRFVEERRGLAPLLEEAAAVGRLRTRPIHGDPKVDNVLFDDATGRAVALVDLDTVKPGLLLWDLGDCLRSACNRLGEEAPRWEDVRFDLDLGRALLAGHAEAAGGALTAGDRELLADAVRGIAFELGLRFLTDHLEGDVYFRVERPGHNLGRALVQFRLVESIEDQEAGLRALALGA